MNALDYDKLSKAEKQKLGNYCNDALKKRLKKVAILTESEANYEHAGKVRPGSAR